MTTPPRPDQEIDPPAQVIAPGGAAGVFRGRLVIIFGSSTTGASGLFVYSGPPAQGNLIYSIVAASGTDLVGNAVLAGATNYTLQSAGRWIAVNLINGQFGFFTATTEAGPWTNTGIFLGLTLLNAVNALNFQTPLVSLNGNTATAFSGTMTAVNPANTGAAETWHSMGAMSNGWSVGGHASYTLLPNGWLGVAFKDLVPGTDADGTVIWSSANGLPAAYQPSNSHRVIAYTTTLRVSGAAFESAALEFETDGSIQCFGVAAAATRLDLFTAIPLNDS